MVSVYILRHAKSDWHAGAASDAARPLNRRGVRAAGRVGRFLARLEEVPELVLCSPARRTQETLALAQEEGAWLSEVLVEEDLYGASAAGMLGLIQAHEAGLERLMLVGHEPACAELVSLLVGGAELRFPTAAVCRIDLRGPAAAGAGELQWLLTPRLLKAAGC